MATKQRVQVRDLADAPRLQATIQSGGNYNVAVQQAGDNKMLQLARSLEMVNPMLRNATSVVAMDNAQRRRDALTDLEREKEVEELAKNKALSVDQRQVIEELKKSEKRRKGFRNTLLKRAINNDLLPSMEAEADNLLDVDKFKTQEEFKEAVNAFIDGKWEDFSAEVGNNVADTDAAKILWNHVVDPYRLKMDASYDKKLDEAIAYGQEEEVGLQLDAFTRKRIDEKTGQVIKLDVAGLGDIAENREQLLKEAGIADKKTRNAIIINSYGKKVDSLIANGRYADAERMLTAMSVIKVNGKPIFRTTDAQTVVTPLVNKLNTALRVADSTSSTTARQAKAEKDERFSNSVVDVISTLRAVDTREEATDLDIKEMSNVFRRLGVPEGDVNGLVDQVFNGPSKPMAQFREVLRQAGNNSNYSDEVQNRYLDNVDNINRGLKEAETTPIRASALTPEEITKEKAVLQQYLEKNPGDTWRDFARTRNYRLPDEMKAYGDELVKGDYVLETDMYKNVDRSLDSRLDVILDSDDYEDVSSGEGRIFVDSNAKFIKERLERKALEVADKPEAERNQALDDELNAALSEEEERFKARLDAKQSSIGVDKPLTEAEIKKIIKDGKAERSFYFSNVNDFEYVSLVAADQSDNPSVNISTIKKEREDMIEKERTAQLKRSLFHYGFDSWTPKSIDMLEKSRMDADDVKLFKDEAELRDISIEWDEVMQKDERGETLNEEEKETRTLFNKLGIYNEATLLLFFRAQTTLLGI